MSGITNACTAAGFSAMIDNCFHTPLTTPDAEEADPLQPLLPTRNHGMVVPGAVYRSSYPRVENHEFIKTLKLKTILSESLLPRITEA